MIICFFGPDGSGKSTLARALAKRFSDKGFKVKLSWMRGTHTLTSLLARFLSKFSVFRGSNNPYYGISIPKRIDKLWQFLEFISILPVFLLRFLLPSLLGYVVIGDRGMLDFVVWISMVSSSPSFARSFLGRIVLAFALKHSLNIYIKANLNILKSRRKDATSESLKYQLLIYDVLAKSLKVSIIDTTRKSVKVSLKEVSDQLRLKNV